ncbi:ubiquitin carboxyl-terminal hydrolase 5-like [Brachionus plicatilis]|uniref:Ubiquitin carboxyl-terminal hydrolase n=1 Tax=Brachionus plicatilis TaxID=10195 RepID=A0A3M7R5L1_BRAPC|nr:ubiquitin carboxyl-terminal hydrolase 5-like [Brachionus plicatilis]
MSTRQLVQSYSNQARIATQSDKVYKDECVYTFDTAESPDGLFVCLASFIAVGKQSLATHFEKTNSHLYLHIKTLRHELPSVEEPEKKITKLAIGVEGGFDLAEKKYSYDTQHSLFIYPQGLELPLDQSFSNPDSTEQVTASIRSIIKAESASLKQELDQAWDGDIRCISKHSNNLLQLPDPAQISPDPRTWKCEVCGMNSNLWLNLTDGKIFCGRRQLDGSGGNNHAIEHYEATKYPLSVKLGTISAKGADVYSYDEDDMVEDTNLAVHLCHFGINMSKMEKTEKTMAELEIDLNQKVGEWDRIQESGSKLEPVYGPGFTGMKNLGNSCYVNSVVQVLFTIPDFVNKYFTKYEQYKKCTQRDPSGDLNFQLSRLGHGLLSGRYADQTQAIRPVVFKNLVGKGHTEFSTKKQQDACEYLIYLIDQIERSLRKDSVDPTNPSDCFKFQLEDRIECMQTHMVSYKRRDEYCLSLPLAKDKAVNRKQVEECEAKKLEMQKQGLKLEPAEMVRPEIRLEDCLDLFTQNEVIGDFYSSAARCKGEAKKSTKIATFPDYLVMQARRFDLAPDWTPIKLDVALQVADQLDLESYRAKGIQNGELELPENDGQEPECELNEATVSQLMDMGFSVEGSKRAVFNTKGENSSEAAVNWAVMHMEDADFNAPFSLPSRRPSKKAKIFDDESVNSLISFGFSRAQAVRALEETNGSLERAADWLFNHPDVEMEVSESSSENTRLRDGHGKYELVALISHMGSNANVGHYVAHIKKENQWVIFNDEKVAKSENPPKDLAYLYFYKRV